MALTKLTAAVNNIQELDDNPNISGMDASTLKAQFDKAGTDIKNYINNTLTEELDTKINNINTRIDSLYPIGSIYMSVNNVNPSTIFGGTWEQIEDRFLLASGSTYSAGTTGGEATVTLTTNQIPSHRHIGDYYYPGGEQQWYSDSGSTLGGSGNKYIYTNDNTTLHGGQKHNSVGGGQAHNNMPPYLAVYVWKRVS